MIIRDYDINMINVKMAGAWREGERRGGRKPYKYKNYIREK